MVQKLIAVRRHWPPLLLQLFRALYCKNQRVPQTKTSGKSVVKIPGDEQSGAAKKNNDVEKGGAGSEVCRQGWQSICRSTQGNLSVIARWSVSGTQNEGYGASCRERCLAAAGAMDTRRGCSGKTVDGFPTIERIKNRTFCAAGIRDRPQNLMGNLFFTRRFIFDSFRAAAIKLNEDNGWMLFECENLQR